MPRNDDFCKSIFNLRQRVIDRGCFTSPDLIEGQIRLDISIDSLCFTKLHNYTLSIIQFKRNLAPKNPKRLSA